MMKTIEITIHLKDTGLRIHSKCCRCGRVRIGDQWELIPSLRDNQHLYSHGFCPQCADKEWRQLASTGVFDRGEDARLRYLFDMERNECGIGRAGGLS